MHHLQRTAAAFMAAVGCAGAIAAPYVPADDNVVLERVRTTARPALAASGKAPELRTALALASLEVEQARRTADPRHLGRAQAILRPWWNTPLPETPVLMLRASIRQSLHEFDAARADLLSVLQREPRNAQALLTLAVVEQVTGGLASARARCAALAPLVASLVHAACEGTVDAAAGRANEAIVRIDRAFAVPDRTSAAVSAWALTVKAESAARVGRDDEAVKAFTTALARDPGDLYARGAFADLLLDLGRPGEALALVRGRGAADALLLREALAARATGAAEAASLQQELAARFAAGRARGDRVHLREEARFALELQGDATRALSLALENWRVQKEPADARIVLEAAAAARAPARAAEVARFVRATGLEDARIHALLARTGA